MHAAAHLSAVALLLATVGGFGALLSFVSPEIRAYNRISPFLAFLALLAVAFWIDRATRTRPQWLRVTVCALVLAIGVADQYAAVKDLSHLLPHAQPAWRDASALVEELEPRLPPGSMVFQFPTRPYPGDSGVNRMGVYDHFLPYLRSRQLRWSYPTLSHAQRDWEKALLRLPREEWPARLKQAGFRAVLIDRAAFRDNGEGTAALLRTAPGITTIVDQPRYLALDLGPR